MNFSKKKLALLCTLCVLAAGNNAFAEETAAQPQNEDLQSFMLDTVVVTATKNEQNLFEANANISVVTAEDIERMHYTTVEEALRSIPNVQFFNYGMASNSASKIRINGSDQVVVLMDGVRVSIPGSGGKQFSLSTISDMDNIERIEVLKGSASILYGGDAKGGVINIITKKTFNPKTKITVAGGDVTKENYKFSTQGQVGKTGFRVYAQKNIMGDYEDGAGTEWDNNDNNENIGVMLKHDLGEESNLILNYSHLNDDFSYFDKNYKDYTNIIQGNNLDGYNKTDNLQLIYNQKISDSMHNVLSYNYSDIKQKINYSTDLGNNLDTDYKMWSINDTLTKKFGNTHTVTGGFERIEYKYDDVSPNAEFGNKKTIYTSYFLQDEWNFDQKWKLTSGVRYDRSSTTDDNYSKSFNLGYKFNDKTNVYAAYNDYFVLPDMYKLYSTSYGNPDLLPEKGKNYEVGFNHMLDDKTSISTHYFYREPDRIIYFGTTGYENADDVEKVHGWDVQLDRQFDDAWSANIGYSRLSYESNIDSTATYLPKNAVTLGVNYTKDKWDVGLDGRAFIGRVNYAKSSNGAAFPSDNYWVFNLSANYKATENIKVFAKLNNIFDQEYAEQTNVLFGNPNEWYGMPGRNFIAGVEVSF